MVLSFSSLLMVATWFAQRQGKAWVRPGAVSTQTKTSFEPSFRRRGPTQSICQSLICWELQWMTLAVALAATLNVRDMLLSINQVIVLQREI